MNQHIKNREKLKTIPKITSGFIKITSRFLKITSLFLNFPTFFYFFLTCNNMRINNLTRNFGKIRKKTKKKLNLYIGGAI